MFYFSHLQNIYLSNLLFTFTYLIYLILCNIFAEYLLAQPVRHAAFINFILMQAAYELMNAWKVNED